MDGTAGKEEKKRRTKVSLTRHGASRSAWPIFGSLFVESGLPPSFPSRAKCPHRLCRRAQGLGGRRLGNTISEMKQNTNRAHPGM